MRKSFNKKRIASNLSVSMFFLSVFSGQANASDAFLFSGTNSLDYILSEKSAQKFELKNHPNSKHIIPFNIGELDGNLNLISIFHENQLKLGYGINFNAGLLSFGFESSYDGKTPTHTITQAFKTSIFNLNLVSIVNNDKSIFPSLNFESGNIKAKYSNDGKEENYSISKGDLGYNILISDNYTKQEANYSFADNLKAKVIIDSLDDKTFTFAYTGKNLYLGFALDHERWHYETNLNLPEKINELLGTRDVNLGFFYDQSEFKSSANLNYDYLGISAELVRPDIGPTYNLISLNYKLNF